MKILYSVLLGLLYVITVQADPIEVYSVPKHSTVGSTVSNPDRRRVAGSALILQHDGVINEPSIPSNAIATPQSNLPDNKISNTVDIKEDVGTHFIVK